VGGVATAGTGMVMGIQWGYDSPYDEGAVVSEHHRYGYTRGFCTGIATGTRIGTRTRTRGCTHPV
jgi:hypothetical protein